MYRDDRPSSFFAFPKHQGASCTRVSQISSRLKAVSNSVRISSQPETIPGFSVLTARRILAAVMVFSSPKYKIPRFQWYDVDWVQYTFEVLSPPIKDVLYIAEWHTVWSLMDLAILYILSQRRRRFSRTLCCLASNSNIVHPRNSLKIAFLTFSSWRLRTFAPQRTANARKIRLCSKAAMSNPRPMHAAQSKA